MPGDLAHVLAANRKAQSWALSTGNTLELGGVWRTRLEEAAGGKKGEDRGGREDDKGEDVSAERKEVRWGLQRPLGRARMRKPRLKEIS